MPATSATELLLRAREALVLATGPSAPRRPPTFMIGAPRCGTTLVGLHVLNALELAYFPNVSKRRRKTPLLAAQRALRTGAWTPSYDNRYGTSEGELAPSDGWDIYSRWFPDCLEAREEHGRAAGHLARLVAGFELLFDAPFFSKNNANSMRVRALAALFPTALFVHVRRSLPEAAASLLEARERHDVKLGEWWSAAPPQLLRSEFVDTTEQALATVWGIERYLEETLPRVAPGRTLRVDYEHFCERPEQVVEDLVRLHALAGSELRRRPGALPRRFRASRLPPERRAELERCAAALIARLESELGRS